jgi:hypothetical protein
VIRLNTFREHCLTMAEAEHKPGCPSLTAKKPHWDRWAVEHDRGGPEPPWEPPTCDGCNPESDRALFAQMAAEVRAYEQGELTEAAP